MKLTDIIEKLTHYLAAFDEQYTITAHLIYITPDARNNVVYVYIAGQFYDAIPEFMYNDNLELIDRATGIIRAAMLVKRLQTAG